MNYEETIPLIKFIYKDIKNNQEKCNIQYILDKDGSLQIKNHFEKQEEYDEKVFKYSIKDVIEWLDNYFKWLDNTKDNYYWDYPDIHGYNEYKQSFDKIKKLKNEENRIELRDLYYKLKKIESNIFEYNKPYYPYNEFKKYDCIDINEQVKRKKIKVTTEDMIKKDYGINAIPKIIFYEETNIEQQDLVTTPSNIKNSKFFNALFKSIGIDVYEILNTYNIANINQAKRREKADDINKKITEIINTRFNDLFFKKNDDKQKYEFQIILEETKIILDIRYNDNVRYIEKQSKGFRWFFNFFFNCLYNSNISAGDIVLIDEPDIRLSIPGRKDLRKFIKNFAIDNGITFITTTHNPSFLDIDYLEEIRIIKAKKDDIGVEIQNDFSVGNDNEVDTLSEIIKSFGILHRDIITNPNNKIIFVEGISDYHYLTAFKILQENINIIFLPFNGLGKNLDDMDNKIKILSKFPQPVIILIDGDSSGNTFKNQCDKDNINIIKLSDIKPEFKTIEDLFDSDDEHKPNKDDEYKGLIAKSFKYKILKNKENVCEKTQQNFNEVFNYIIKDKYK